MAVSLSDSEMELLADESLSLEARNLYALVLRPNMSFKTGVVGDPARVSISGMRDRLTVRRAPTSKLGDYVPSIKQVRRFIAELLSVGLLRRLEPCGPRDPLLFLCVCARSDFLRLREDGHKKGMEGGACVDKSVPPISKGFQALGGGKFSEDGHCENPEDGHISGISVTSNKNKYISSEVISSGSSVTIPNDWEPGVGVVDCIREEYGFSEEFLSLKSKEFWLYWVEAGGVHTDWDGKFYGHVKFHMNNRSAEFVLAARKAI